MAEPQAGASDIVAIICHELRNHLSPVVTWTEVLARIDLTLAERREAVAALHRALAVLHRLIDDLSAWESGGALSVQWVRLDFRDVVRDAVLTARLEAHGKGVRVIGTLPERPMLVVGDPVRLAEVVTNLLRNAVEHTVSAGTINVALAMTRDQQLVLSVTDTGTGITPDSIGLYLVKHFVELHHGRVEVSEGGRERGSRFLITLPIAADAA